MGTAERAGECRCEADCRKPVIRVVRECDVNDKQVPPVEGQRRSGSLPPAGRTPATAVAALKASGNSRGLARRHWRKWHI